MALQSQIDCRTLLVDHYEDFQLGGERRLWIYKH